MANKAPKSRPLRDPTTLDRYDFDEALLRYGARTWFVWWLFMLCSTSCILNGYHVMSYVFYSETPRHWCRIPVLEEAKWTSEQIQSVSSPSPEEDGNCEYYEWNYEEFKQMGYEKAYEKFQQSEKPSTKPCEEFFYDLEDANSSFVPEWDMVCDRLVMKASVQTAISFGKLVGAFSFGVIADKYGRKTTYVIASVIYMMSSAVISWTRLYLLLLICRVGVGIAAIGIYQAAYSLLVELCPPHLRSTLGVLFNQSYPVGMIYIATVAYYIRPWRTLQMILAVPTYFLIFHMLVIPESPRWAYYSGRPMYAWSIIKKFVPPAKKQMYLDRRISTVVPIVEQVDTMTKIRQMKQKIMSQLVYLKHREVCLRLILCWTIWCFTSMSYYALSITSGYLKIDRYLYTGLSGIVEGVSYISVVPLLHIIGRRGTASLLLFASGGSFITNLYLPPDMKNAKMFFALFGRLAISSVYVAVIIHASELFPTVMRNTAIGTSSAWSHVGSTLAPYLVDYFVIYGWWVPNVMCGGTAFVSGIIVQFLPETKDLVLYNTMDEFIEKCQANPEERISLKHFILFRIFKKRSAVASASTS